MAKYEGEKFDYMENDFPIDECPVCGAELHYSLCPHGEMRYCECKQCDYYVEGPDDVKDQPLN